jgi:hypothetical protein
MSLRATIASAVSATFTALGDIPSSATYRRTVTTYDPTTGNNTSVNTDYTITAIFTRFSELELGRNAGLQVTDQKMIVQQVSLSVTPSIQLDTVISGGKTYNLVNFNPDPAGATYTFQLRAP